MSMDRRQEGWVRAGIAQLLELKPGWDSYSARPLSRVNARRAVRLLNEVMRPDIPLPAIVPTVHGGIQLEWHIRGVDLEICIEPREEITFIAAWAGFECESEMLLQGHEQELMQWLDRLSL